MPTMGKQNFNRIIKMIKINKKDMTASEDSNLYFITHMFKNGKFLAFYSHSPWGRIKDQERGWVVIDKAGIIDSVSTYCFGPTDNDYRGWLRKQIDLFGSRTIAKNEFDEPFWKMSE